MLKLTISFLGTWVIFFLFISQVNAQEYKIDDFFEAYKTTFEAQDNGLNMPKEYWKPYKIVEKKKEYLKFMIEDINLTVEMSLFKGKSEESNIVLVYKYYSNDFRSHLQSLKAYSLNFTPLGSPLEEFMFPHVQLQYIYYTQFVNMVHTQIEGISDDAYDSNYMRVLMPKNGENTIYWQYAPARVENGMVVEDGLDFVPEKFINWAKIIFIPSETYGYFDYQAIK